MKTFEIITLSIWYILGLSAILTIMVREDGWTPRKTTIGDILCIVILPIFGPNIWAFYGIYLLMCSNILNTPIINSDDNERN